MARIVSGTAEDMVDKSGRVLEVSPSAAGEARACASSDNWGARALCRVRTCRQGRASMALTWANSSLLPTMPRMLWPNANSGWRTQLRTGSLATSGRPRPVLLGDASGLSFKLAVLEELASRVTLAAYSQVDLTVPQRPALTPLPSGVLAYRLTRRGTQPVLVTASSDT